MLERIKDILKSESLTSGSFADEIGVQRSSLSHILNGRNNPSLDFVIKTLQRFPALNPEWFLLGKGEMYTSLKKDVVPSPEPPANHDLFSSIIEKAPVHQEETQKEVLANTSDNEEIVIKNMDKYVSQILIFYSDSTYQIFKPENRT